MRYGLFSDIHSNLEALNVVLEHLEQEKVNAYIFCGDIVGYGPDPNRCVERVSQLKNLTAVCGNHDLAVVGEKDLDWFNPTARESLLWTAQQLSDQNRQFLTQLPQKQTLEHFTVVHGSALRPNDDYLLTAGDCQKSLDYFSTPLLFCGHTHKPFWFYQLERENHFIRLENETNFQLNREKNILNLGSVGQPRDGHNQACCAIFDQETNILQFRRLKYDFVQTQKKMKEAELSAYLIARLACGT